MNNDIEEHIIQQLAKQMKDEIDFQVYTEAVGWTMVEFRYWLNNRDAADVTNWLEENCEAEWQMRGSKVAFESDKDATIFSLKWV